jgi:hypothetical protein
VWVQLGFFSDKEANLFVWLGWLAEAVPVFLVCD